MRVLYIGGTGEISFDCIHESVRLGHEVTVFNRGHHNAGLPDACRLVTGDVEDDAAYRAPGRLGFRRGLPVPPLHAGGAPSGTSRFFTGHCGQYVFISSASAYRKPVRGLPITEAHAARQSVLGVLARQGGDGGAAPGAEPLSRTPSSGRATPTAPGCRHRCREHVEVSRMLRGKPVVLHGDGESLWTRDARRGFRAPLRAAARQPRRAGRGVPHHRRPRLAVERDLRGDRRRARRAARAGARGERHAGALPRRVGGPAARRQEPVRDVRQLARSRRWSATSTARSIRGAGCAWWPSATRRRRTTSTRRSTRFWTGSSASRRRWGAESTLLSASTAGTTAAARRAGIQLASSTTTASTATMPARVSGSRGATS